MDKKKRPTTLYVSAIELPKDIGYEEKTISIDIEITAEHARKMIRLLTERSTNYDGGIRLRLKGRLVL